MKDIGRTGTQYADISRMRANTLKLSNQAQRKDIYVYGNTAVEFMPDTYPEEIYPKKKPAGKPEHERNNGRRENAGAPKTVRRSRENASGMSVVYSMLLAVAAVAALVLCIMYLGVQSEISEKTAYISKLKSDITVVKTNNDAMDFSINSYIDVDNIYKVATEELGMIHATQNQIKIYEGREPEYMKQMGDIPEK